MNPTCQQLNEFTMGHDLMHVTIPKNILCFPTITTSIDFCCGMNLDMVDHRIFNKGDFSTNTTKFIKKIFKSNFKFRHWSDKAYLTSNSKN